MNSGRQAGIITVVFNFVAILFVCVRCVSRFIIVKNYGNDDILMIAAAACSTGFTAAMIFQIQHGLGDLEIFKDRYQFMLLMKGFYISLPFYHSGLALVKCSILLQYLRFFPLGRSRQVCWFMIVFTTTYCTLAVAWGFSICLPVAYVWDRSIPGTCPLVKLAYMNAGLAIISDLVISVLPVTVLKDLRISKLQKYALICIFVLGGMSCIAATIRVNSVVAMVNSPVLGADNKEGLLWSAIELNIGMIAACLPTFKPVLVRVAPRLFSSSSSASSGHGRAVKIRKRSVGFKGKEAVKSVHTLSRSEIEESDTIISWTGSSAEKLC